MLTFRRLADLADPAAVDGDAGATAAGVGELFEIPDAMLPWLSRWQQRLAQEPDSASQRQAAMYRSNPAFIPRNHLVEEAIQAASRDGDLAPFRQMLEVLANPWEYRPEQARHATPPRPEQIVRQTFCGT